VAGFLLVLLIILDVIPFPNHFRSPGVLQASTYSVVVPETSGIVEEVLSADGSRVSAGDPLLRLVNTELALQIRSAEAQLEQTQAMQRRALREATADLKPLESRAEATRKLLHRLEESREALVLRAAHDGTWVAPGIKDSVGSWLERGTPVGQVIDESEFYFSAIVSQNEASRLFSKEILGSDVKLFGQAGELLAVESRKVIPVEKERLPSAAIGWAGGGDVAVDMSEQSGTRTAEPFFEVRANIGEAGESQLLHGRGGRIRFDLPAEPLLRQWMRKLRQLLQNRYGI
jgi:putative peptide zinc metalloprotease protein